MLKTPSLRDYLGISVFWFAVNFFWGAMLFVVVQARVHDLVQAEAAHAATSRGAPTRHVAPRNTRVATPPSISPSPRSANPVARTPTRTAASVHKQLPSPPAGSARERALESETNRRLGWLLGIGALVSTLTQLLFGAFSDNCHHRLGRRRPFLIGGVLLANAGTILFLSVHTYLWLFVSYLLVQFFLSVALGPYQALVPDLIPREHEGQASAWMGLWQLLGRAGGMTAGSVLLLSKSGLFILMVLFLALFNGLMAATTLLTRERQLKHRFPGGAWGSLANLFKVELLRHPSFLWLLASRMAINLGIYTVMPFIQYYLMHVFGLTQHQTLQKQEIIGIIVNVAGVSAAYPAGTLSDRYPKKRIVLVACYVCIAAGVGFAVSHSVTTALISSAVFGFGYGAFQSVDWALVINVLPPGQPAKYMGLWSLGDTLPQILAPMFGYLLVNWVIAHYNEALGYRSAMAAAMIWFTVGTIFIRFVKEHRTQGMERNQERKVSRRDRDRDDAEAPQLRRIA